MIHKGEVKFKQFEEVEAFDWKVALLMIRMKRRNATTKIQKVKNLMELPQVGRLTTKLEEPIESSRLLMEINSIKKSKKKTDS